MATRDALLEGHAARSDGHAVPASVAPIDRSATIDSINNNPVDSAAAEGRRALILDGGFWTAVLTISNAALGAGLLSVPYAFFSAGLLVGSLTTGVLILACFASLCVIMARMAKAQAADDAICSFGGLVGWGCGARASWLVEILVLLNSFGACVGYLVLLGDVLTPLLHAPLERWLHLDGARARTAVVLGASLVALLLCLLRRISALRYSAAVAVFACFFVAGMLAAQASEHSCAPGDCADEVGRNGWCTRSQAASNATAGACNAEAPLAGISAWPVSAAGLLRALPLLINAMQCHIQAAFVFAEMAPPLRTPRARRAIAGGATSLLFAFYASVGLAGFMRFGAQTQGDILKNFGPADGAASVARLSVAITAISAFPMQHFPARSVTHRIWRLLVRDRAEKPRMSLPFILIEAALWVGVTAFLALLLGSNLSFVFELLGAVVVGAVVFLVPAALLLATKGERGARRARTRLLAAAFVAVGSFLTVSGTYISIEQEVVGKK